jgi:anti-sigma B factor antagonist
MSDDAETAFKVTLEPRASSIRVVVAGELDIATVPELSPHVTAGDDGDAVILDLAAVTFIDSTGLRLLIEAHAALGERLRIVPSPACERLFEITGVRDRLPIAD